MPTVRSRPRVFLVRMGEPEQAARSHVLALAQYGSEVRVMGELRELVESFQVPWRAPMRLAVDTQGAVSIPREVFLGAALGSRRWFRREALSEVAARYRSSFEWGTDYAVCLSKGGNVGTFWRGGHSVLVVDLDARRLSNALSLLFYSVPLAVRPLASYERGIVSGHGHEWDSAAATFRSPAESRASFRGDRAAARDAFVGSGRRLIHARRWERVRTELANRARLRGSTVETELRDEVRRGLDAIEVQECVSEFLARAVRSAVARPDNPEGAVRRTMERTWSAFLRRLWRELGEYLHDAILPGRRRLYENPPEVFEDDLARVEAGIAEKKGGPESTVLEEIAAEEFLGRLQARLSPAEIERLASLVSGEGATAYAKRTGRSPGTVYAQDYSIRRKGGRLGGSA